MDTSAWQQRIEIRVFHLLGELPNVIKSHLPVCQLYLWQLGPNMWSLPMTKLFDPIIVTTLQMGFPGVSHGPTTCVFACNCPEPEAWTTETSELLYTVLLPILFLPCFSFKHQVTVLYLKQSLFCFINI